MKHSLKFQREPKQMECRCTSKAHLAGAVSTKRFGKGEGLREWWRRAGRIETKGVVGRETIGSSSTPRVCNEGSKKTRRSEVKRADLLWQVAQGRRCPNRPPIAPPSPPLCRPSPHPVPHAVFKPLFSLFFSPVSKALAWLLCPLSFIHLLFPSPFALDRGSITIIRNIFEEVFENEVLYFYDIYKIM